MSHTKYLLGVHQLKIEGQSLQLPTGDNSKKTVSDNKQAQLSN